MIRVTPVGTEFAGRPADIERLRRQFDRESCILLPGLVEPGLLQHILKRIDQAPFSPRTHEGVGEELCIEEPVTLGLLTLLVNDPRLFQVVQEITGCGPIGSFLGRVYRMVPGRGHYDSWHDDMGDDRLVALSLNLSPEVYSGGVLQIRHQATGRIVHAVANTGLGDAILFRISRELRHCVSKVEGTAPKTAFAGWFKSQPSFRDWVHECTLGAVT